MPIPFPNEYNFSMNHFSSISSNRNRLLKETQINCFNSFDMECGIFLMIFTKFNIRNRYRTFGNIRRQNNLSCVFNRLKNWLLFFSADERMKNKNLPRHFFPVNSTISLSSCSNKLINWRREQLDRWILLSEGCVQTTNFKNSRQKDQNRCRFMRFFFEIFDQT